MTFYRAQTSAVTIGRKSSSDHKLGQGADGPGNAGFSCQVVSGKHAKLAFSDSGYVNILFIILADSPELVCTLQAYLIDLGSRHGTHILHPGETVSKMLDPEAATTLSNGDIITFGKTVGKGSYVVSPVTARVELLFGDQSENGSIGSANTSTRSPLVVPENGPTRSGRTGSGRYGLYIPSSLSSPDGSSEDDSSAKFDHDSDIEEITPPSSSHDRPVRHHFGPSLPFPFFRGLQAHVYEDSHDGATCFNSFDDLRLPAIDRPPERSRSHSPMDLSSPTPTPIGAWPSVVAHSPSANSSLESNAVESSDDEDSQESEGDAEQSAPQATTAAPPQPQATAENPDPRDGEVGISAAHQPPYDESRSPSPPSEFDLQGREKEQERQLEKEQEQEIHDTMVEVSAIVSRMHVSVVF
jgi:pSer/pThr/pTyr-binding forkhead associated (FHA) protein